METNTQPNRQMLRRICKLGQVAGWAMIALGVLGVGGYAYAHLIAHVNSQPTLYQSILTVSDILTGLLVLTSAQFVRYVIEEDAEPGWFLRNGHIILGFFALFLFLTGVLYGWPQLWTGLSMFSFHPPEHMIPMGRELGVASITLITFLPPTTKALCVLGVAAMLRTVLPILTESKTLA
ncbi:MAG: hypothetical protein V2A74_03285 [bacterium]